MRQKDDEQYTKLFLLFSDRAELWFKRILISLLILLSLFQAALRIPMLRDYLASADKYEGVPIHRDKGK